MAVNERRIPMNRDEQKQRDIQVMSSDDKLNLARTSTVAVRKHSPTWCAHAAPIESWEKRKEFYILKVFSGGVPLNTETAAVKPRVDSAS